MRRTGRPPGITSITSPLALTQADEDPEMDDADRDERQGHCGHGAAERIGVDGKWWQERKERLAASNGKSDAGDAGQEAGGGANEQDRARHGRSSAS